MHRKCAKTFGVCKAWIVNANACREHLVAASPALLQLLAQVLFVTSEDEALQLAGQQPDPSLHQAAVPHEIACLKICKRLLIAMEVTKLAYSWSPMPMSSVAKGLSRFHAKEDFRRVHVNHDA